MPIEFWIGPAGSGKTHRCLEELRRLEAAHRPAFFLVPEQFTYTADRLLLEETVAGARHVRVLSFQRLAYLIEAEEGPFPPAIGPGGREMLLRLVVNGMSDESLGPLSSQRGKEGFIRSLARTVRDLRIHGRASSARSGGARIRIAGLDGAAALGEMSARKLRALDRILEAYEQLLGAEGLRDPEERLDHAVALMGSSKALPGGLSVFVDGFMSFTAPETRALAALAGGAARCVMTLCIDPDDLEAYREAAGLARRAGIPSPETGFPRTVYERLDRPVFSPTSRTLLLLEDALNERGLAWAVRSRRDAPRFRSAPGLARVEKEAMRSGGESASAEASTCGVEIRPAVHPAEEVLIWARRIDRWIRLGELAPGERVAFRDVALLLPDPSSYAALLDEIFPRYGIPYFLDLPADLTAHPFPAALLALLGVLERRWSRDAVMGLLRSPLLELTRFEADLVENVSLEYGIEYKRWHAAPWRALILPPRRRRKRPVEGEGGSGPAEDDAPQADPEADDLEDDLEDDLDPGLEWKLRIQEVQIDVGNSIRGRILAPLARYQATWGDGAVPFRAAVDGLLVLVDDLGLTAAQSRLARDESEANLARQIQGRVASLLEDGVRLMGDVPVTPALLSRLLRDGLGALRLGRTPRSLDAVTVGDFQRSRVNEARGVIVGGLTAEAVPRTVPDKPLLTREEEEWLAAAGLSTGPSPQARQDEEAYLAYIALTRARDRLLLTFPATTTTGDALHISPYISLLAGRLGLALPRPGSEEGESAGPRFQTEEELASQVGRRLAERIERESAGRDPEPEEAALEEAFYDEMRKPGLFQEGRFEILRRAVTHERPWILERSVLSVLYPDEKLPASSSSLETFAKCPYKNFAQRVLRLEPRPEAVIQPRNTGTALHRALEILFERPEGLPTGDAVEEKLRAIFDELRGETEFLAFTIDAPSRYHWDRGRRGLSRYAQAELRRLQNALYKPALVEAGFGFPGEGRGPLVIPAGARGQILIRGRMDRVDVKGPIREDGETSAVVLDYKSRLPKKIAIQTELERGERLQTGIYMLALRRVFGMKPAGGFYAPILPTPEPGKKGKPGNPLDFRLYGVVRSGDAAAVDPEMIFLNAPGKGGKTVVDDARLESLLKTTEAYAAYYGGRMLGGEIRAVPLHGGSGMPRVCGFCDYRDLCRFDPMKDPVLAEQPRPGPDAADGGAEPAGGADG